MEYKALDVVVVTSTAFAAMAALGLVLLTLGPLAQPSAPTARMALTFSLVAFSMIAIMARNARALLAAQADQIATLQRQLADRQHAG